MSLPPDPNELSAPRDPGSYGRSRLMGPAFWALIAFGVLCIAAGYGVAKFGPELYPARPVAAPAATPAPAPATTPASLSPADVFAPAEPAAPGAEVAHLTDRLDALEVQQSRTAQAAAGALAAAALMEAAQTSRPFVEEVAALAAVTPPSAELRSLRSYAELGAPSHAALAASFPDYAARAAAASHAPGEGAGLAARIGHVLSRVVTVRRVGEVSGSGVDAVIAKAEMQVEDGDLVTALATLNGLPPAGREALAPWRTRAERRADIDRRIAEVRSHALEDLARLSRSDG
jgi:hypothetical protein